MLQKANQKWKRLQETTETMMDFTVCAFILHVPAAFSSTLACIFVWNLVIDDTVANFCVSALKSR